VALCGCLNPTLKICMHVVCVRGIVVLGSTTFKLCSQFPPLKCQMFIGIFEIDRAMCRADNLQERAM
jgi:hypothetical protein